MANHKAPEISSFSFSDFPDDIQICILSFLSPTELANFACTSKRFVSLCRNDNKLWYSMCDRRWGPKTQINEWGKITYKQLYRTLNEWDNLIGFWRRCGDPNISLPPPPPLVYFEWGPSFLTASRVSPSQNGSYQVTKSPFLFMGISPEGEVLNYLDLDGHSEILGDFVNFSELGFLDKDLILVNVNFMGNGYLIVEENHNFIYNNNNNNNKREKNGIRRSSSSTNLVIGEESEDVIGGTSGSLPDRLVSEIYIQMANRTSPGADRRRQRRKERKKKWETEHFVKIVNCSPTSSRPLQGLWKGICDDMYLDFYFVAYDEIGGIVCRRVGDLFSCNGAPVFWTSHATFIESPFPTEEEIIYDGRIHLRPPAAENHIPGQHHLTDIEVVSRILHISSSYELVIPGLAGTSVNPRLGEGRIWQYENGTFGFGFLRDNVIIDLKCIVQDGCLLDTMEPCSE